MSNFSTTYDQIRSVLATLFSDKGELESPDNLIDNVDQVLTNGFGVIVGPAVPQDFDYADFLEDRDFTIVFTEEVRAIPGDKSPLLTIKKNMIEDQVTLKKDFLSSDQIGVSSSVQRIELVSATGVDFIPGKENILTTSVTFAVGISETINT